MVTRDRRPAPFSELELSIADLLVTQVGVALPQRRPARTGSETALRDPLTGLFNRRYFDEAVETALPPPADRRPSSA